MATDLGAAREPSSAADPNRKTGENRLESRDDASIQVGPPAIPWTAAGGPDPAYDATTRVRNRAWLTDPRLIERSTGCIPEAKPSTNA